MEYTNIIALALQAGFLGIGAFVDLRSLVDWDKDSVELTKIFYVLLTGGLTFVMGSVMIFADTVPSMMPVVGVEAIIGVGIWIGYLVSSTFTQKS